MISSAHVRYSSRAATSRSGVSLSCFGFGTFLPLLGGGNTLLFLEPGVAVPMLLVASIAFAAFLLWTQADSPIVLSIRTSLLLLLLVWWAGNLWLRLSGPRAMLEAEALLAGGLLFATLSWRPLFDTEARWLVLGLVVGTVVTTVYGQYQYWVMLPSIGPAMIAIYGQGPFLSINANFYNANCYGPFLAALLILLGGAAPGSSPAWRTFLWLSVPALFVTLILSTSRAALGLLLVVVVLLATSRMERGRRRMVWGAGLVTTLAATIAGSRWIASTELWQTALFGRIDIWRGAWAMIREHWLLGVGLGRFGEFFGAFRVNDFYTRYPHNLFLEVFAETGIAGASFLFAFLATAVAEAIRSVRLSRSVLRRSAFAASILMLAHAMVDIDWHAPANVILLMITLAISADSRQEAAC